MCESDPCHCDCHEWYRPTRPSLEAQLKQWIGEYNAAVANGHIQKARMLNRRITATENVLGKGSK